MRTKVAAPAAVLAILCAFLLATNARASFVSSSYRNGINQISDDSRESLFLQDNTKVQVGDVIVGWFKIKQNSTTSTNFNNQVYAVYSQQISAINVVGTNVYVDFKPTDGTTTAGVGHKLSNLLPTHAADIKSTDIAAFMDNPSNAGLLDLTLNQPPPGGSETIINYTSYIDTNYNTVFTAGLGKADDFLNATIDISATGFPDPRVDVDAFYRALATSLKNLPVEFGFSIGTNKDPNVTYVADISKTNPRTGATNSDYQFADLNAGFSTTYDGKGANLVSNAGDFGAFPSSGTHPNPLGFQNNGRFVIDVLLPVPVPSDEVLSWSGVCGMCLVYFLVRRTRRKGSAAPGC